jgi:hypothetical protein
MKFSSAKAAIHYYFNHQLMAAQNDIETLWVRIQRTIKGGSGAMWLGLELGDMVRPINKLKTLPKAWAMYAFAGEGHYSRYQYVCLIAHVIAACRRDHKMTNLSNDVVIKLYRMAPLALEDYAMRDVTGRPKYKDSEICERIGVKHSNWEKCWKSKFNSMQYALDKLSREALGPISAKLAEIQELEDEMVFVKQ